MKFATLFSALRKSTLCAAFLGASALAVSAVTPAFAAETHLAVNGSTTVLPIMQKVSEAFMSANPNVNISISGGGSGNGIKALNDGLCDIAMASRDMKAKEHKQGEAKGVNAVRFAIAKDALVPVVHPANPVKALSVEQLKSIYNGTVTNWKELGGNNAPIVVISRDSSSGTFETWSELVMHKERVMPAALLQASNGSVVQSVSKNKNAIGYIGFGYLNDSLQGLRVNGVTASVQSGANGTWPLARELYLFTNGSPKGMQEKLINFILDSKKGQRFVGEVGYIPLR